MINDQAWLEGAFIPTVQKRGAAIIEARGASSAASAANAAIDHVRDWIHGTPSGDWVTMGIPSDGSYGIPAGVIYGYPVTCRNGAYEIVQGIDISPFSRARMDATYKELIEERDAVKVCSAELALPRARPVQPAQIWGLNMGNQSAGAKFRAAVQAEKPLQVVGTINAYHARLAERAGYKRYLSVRRRRGRRLAGPARPRHQHPGRRADRRAPHHRRLRACRCWWTSIPASAAPSTSPAR